MKGIQQIKNGMSNEQIEFIKTNDKQSGFFDLPEQKKCNDVEHDPPKHLYIPQGQGYRHVCPSCGKETIIIPEQTYM